MHTYMSVHQRRKWSLRTDAEAVKKRAGGRRRYNAMRKREADFRRKKIMYIAGQQPNPCVLIMSGSFKSYLANILGVHRTTIWRDVQRLMFPSICDFYDNGEFVYRITKACQGGPVVSVKDAEGNEIRGAARRYILKQVPRYYRHKR